MLYRGTTPAFFCRGGKPAKLYKGTQLVAGYAADAKTAPCSWERTYADAIRITAQGRGKQDGTPSADAPVEMVASTGVLRTHSKNLFVPNTRPAHANCTKFVFAPDWLSASALGDASATKPGQSVYSSGTIRFYMHPLEAKGNTYTISFDLEVLEGSNADFVSPRTVKPLCDDIDMGDKCYIADNTSQHVSFRYTTPVGRAALTGLMIACNSQHIRVSNIMIQAGAVEDAPYEQGTASTVTLPELRQIPSTEVRDELSGKILTRRVGVIGSYAGESVGDVWCSSTGQLSSGATVWYQLPAPTEEQLDLGDLNTYWGYTLLAVEGDYPPEITATATVAA